MPKFLESRVYSYAVKGKKRPFVEDHSLQLEGHDVKQLYKRPVEKKTLDKERIFQEAGFIEEDVELLKKFATKLSSIYKNIKNNY